MKIRKIWISSLLIPLCTFPLSISCSRNYINEIKNQLSDKLYERLQFLNNFEKNKYQNNEIFQLVNNIAHDFAKQIVFMSKNFMWIWDKELNDHKTYVQNENSQEQKTRILTNQFVKKVDFEFDLFISSLDIKSSNNIPEAKNKIYEKYILSLKKIYEIMNVYYPNEYNIVQKDFLAYKNINEPYSPYEFNKFVQEQKVFTNFDINVFDSLYYFKDNELFQFLLSKDFNQKKFNEKKFFYLNKNYELSEEYLKNIKNYEGSLSEDNIKWIYYKDKSLWILGIDGPGEDEIKFNKHKNIIINKIEAYFERLKKFYATDTFFEYELKKIIKIREKLL